jgi:hypothetical protein
MTREATNWPKVGARAAHIERLAAPNDEIIKITRTPYMLARGTHIKHYFILATIWWIL